MNYEFDKLATTERVNFFDFFSTLYFLSILKQNEAFAISKTKNFFDMNFDWGMQNGRSPQKGGRGLQKGGKVNAL